MLTFILLIILIALAGGIISGLFGGGSGIIFVPGFFAVLSYYYPHSEHLMQVAISTCFASSIFIGLFASKKQIKYSHVQARPLKETFIYILIGAIIGVYLMTLIPSAKLKLFFAIVLFLIAIWMIKRQFSPTKQADVGQTQKILLAGIAGLCTMLSGVSAFFVPFFIRYGLAIKNAIGASTIITLTLSFIMGILTIIFGLHADHLPPHNLGYLNFSIFLTAIIPSIIGAIIGSRLTYVLPMKPLQYIYIAMVIIVAVIMLV
ncbi:sulfite exporter TauE/SafE family protein [Fangia hongkongensis]|uniref:sulfite exporter TauE/SafE family protein n=2 Tax=Fangia hongkongensis TaxID=270495 RepID=UPI00037A05A3|nr:sulfite exporter TauE/SafE family protein [Fangia hongkongensis]